MSTMAGIKRISICLFLIATIFCNSILVTENKSYAANEYGINRLEFLKNGTPLNSVTNISAEDVIQVVVEGELPQENSLYIFCVLYKGNKMVDVSYAFVDLKNVEGGFSKTITVDCENIDNVDMIKAFVWNGIEQTSPLSTSIKQEISNLVVTEHDIIQQNVRILGRTSYGNGKLSMNWPQTGIEFNFNGTAAEVYVSDVNNTVYANVSVDGSEECNRIEITQSGWHTIAQGLTNGNHTINFTRSSEASNGLISISKLRLDGSDIVPTAEKARKMEFVGDSYTVGYGNLDYGTVTNVRTAKNTDAWRSYAGYAMRTLNADANIVAYSGKGVCMNYVSLNKPINTENTMSMQYLYANPILGTGSSLIEWNFSSYTPQVVVVFLGTNDYSGTTPRGNDPQFFYNSYYTFLNTIRSKYPNSHIIACSKTSGSYGEQVEAAVCALGGDNEKYHYLCLTSFQGSGVGNHPYYTEHAVIAEQLVSKINSIENVWNVSE